MNGGVGWGGGGGRASSTTFLSYSVKVCNEFLPEILVTDDVIIQEVAGVEDVHPQLFLTLRHP